MEEISTDGMSQSPPAWRADRPVPSRVTVESAREPDQGRIGELDGIRGLAAVAIVLFHTQPGWLPLGFAAVDVFFVLSGFLITSIVLKHGDSPGFLRHFYVRRGLRIWPIYYLTLLGFILFRHHLPVRCDWAGLWYYLTYTQEIPRYWSAEPPRFHGFLSHTWTLAIEEQFYLIWPVLVMICGARRVPFLAIGCACLSVMARVFGWPSSLLLARMDGLVLGALLAAVLHFGLMTRSRAGWVFGLMLLLGVSGVVAMTTALHLACNELLTSGVGLLALNVALTGLIGLTLISSGSAWLAPLRWGPLTYLGKISYGLYLYHYVILMISAGRLRIWAIWTMPPGRLLVTVLLCFLAASLSWELIEQPILRLKKRFDYENRSCTVPAPMSGASARGVVAR